MEELAPAVPEGVPRAEDAAGEAPGGVPPSLPLADEAPAGVACRHRNWSVKHTRSWWQWEPQ